MPWIRLDENVMDHPKFLALSDGAWRLWCEGLAYCQKHLTDGVILLAALKGFRYFSAAKLAALTQPFTPEAKPLWTLDDKTVTVNDYLEWNDSKAAVLAAREAAKKRQRDHRHGVTGGVTSPLQTPKSLSGVCDLDLRSSEKPKTFRTALEPVESLRWFDRVYGAYPNKDRKQPAHDAWREIGPDLAMAEAILADIQQRVKHGWVKFERRFIPQLVRYLRERQWEDAAAGDAGVLGEEDPYAKFPHAWQCRCGEIHEGTQAEFKARACLKVAAG